MFHLNITEDSANVQDVRERAREGFAESTLVLVQPNRLRIEDNAVTRGLAKCLSVRLRTKWLWVRVRLQYIYIYI